MLYEVITDNRPKIEYAAEKSLAAEVIEQLPEKYDQQLGKRFTGGKDLRQPEEPRRRREEGDRGADRGDYQ